MACREWGLDVTYVGNVDSSRDATAGESDDLQAGEVRRKELVLLEVLTPGELGNLCRGSVNQFAKRFGPLLVHTSGKSFPLSPDPVRVTVGLDEADVALDSRAEILDPVALRVLVRLHGAVMERLDVLALHGVFLGVGGVLLRLGEVAGDLAHLDAVVAEDQMELLALQRAREGPFRFFDVASRGVSDGGSDEDFEVAGGGLAHASVLGQQALLLEEVGGVSDFLSRDVGRVRVVRRHMALVRVAEVHASDAGLVQVILEGVVKLLGVLTGRCEFGEALLWDARDDLAVTKRAVVARVADELGGVVEEMLEILVRDASLGLHLLPVT